MAAIDVRNTIVKLTADKVLDSKDVDNVIASAGKSVSVEEEKEFEKMLKSGGLYEVPSASKTKAKRYLGTFKQLRAEVKGQNGIAAKRRAALEAEENAILTPGKATQSYGGSPVPEAVKTLMNAAKAAGATPYDVLELKPDPVADEHEAGTYTTDGVWSPYAQEIEATHNMQFSYTEITPQSIQKDMSTERVQWVLVGSDKKRAGQAGKEYEMGRYEKRTMKGTGNIVTRYDEAGHNKTEALGEGPHFAKYASNAAFLADGSLHAVPAMRRTPDYPDLIITNPSLARGKRMLSNFHLEMSAGVVTYVGLSGRLQKLVAEEGVKLVDPLALLKAWGIQTAPGLTLAFEGKGNVKVDAATNMIVKA